MASGSTARPRVFNGDAQNACWEGWEVYTVEVTLVPSAQHVHRRGALGPPLSGSANLDVLAPDSTLREEFEQWRLREDHFWGGYVSGHAATDKPTRWSDAESSPSRGASAK